MSRTEKLLDRAQTAWETEIRELNGLPDPADVDNTWYKYRYQEFRKLLNTRRRLGWASGVFDCLAAISMDEDKTRRPQTFTNGEGI